MYVSTETIQSWCIAYENCLLTNLFQMIILNQISEPIAFWNTCQCFIILCQVLSDWPDRVSAQHLLTLGLDMIGQLDSSLQQHKKSCSDKAASEISEVISALQSECSNIAALELQEPLMKVLDGIYLRVDHWISEFG